MKVPADPEDRTVSVCYRCKTCKTCFVTMEDINRHLQKHNHYIRPADLSSSSSTDGDTTFPPLPLPAKLELDLTVSSDSDQEEHGGNGGDPQGRGTVKVKVKGENGIGDNNNGRSKTSGNGKGASPLKSYAASLKDAEDDAAAESLTKSKLTEQDTVEDMETDEAMTEPIHDEKLWPPVTLDMVEMETGDAVADSLPESKEILQKSKEKEAEPEHAVRIARSPKKTITGSSTSSRASSRTSSAHNESDKAKKTEAGLNETVKEPGVSKRATRNSKSASSSTSESCIEGPKVDIENSTNKPETTTTTLTPVKENSLDEGDKQGPMDQPATGPVTPSRKKKSLSETLTSMKTKFNYMKWRDVPATAFTYSNQNVQNQTLQNEQIVPEPAAGESKKKDNRRKRYKCKLCDEWFLYTVQIISHVNRVHKSKSASKSQTPNPNNPPSPKKIKKAEPGSSAGTNKSSQSGQSYPLRSLHTRTRRSTTEVNKASDTKDKKPRKSTIFTCKHCSQKFPILNQLKRHIHAQHPEAVEKMNLNLRIQAKKRKFKRFRLSAKKKIPQKTSLTVDSTILPSNVMEPVPTASTAIPETKPVKIEDTTNTNQVETNGKSHPKGRTMFSCKHCHEKFPLLNQLKIHLHQMHPNMMGKAKPSRNKVALNGDQKTEDIAIDSTKAIATRRRSQQIKSLPASQPPKEKAEPQPIQRKSTKQLSVPKTEPEAPEDIKPNLPEQPPSPTMMKIQGAANNGLITIEDEPDCFVDTAETILAALMSKQSQTCPNCMKFFRFAGSLRNHLKVCTDEYFASFDIEDEQNENSHVGENEMVKQIKVESEDEVEDEEDEERMEIEEEEEVDEEFKTEDRDADTTEEGNKLEDSSSGTQPYYYQLEYRRCWLCDAVVARFYNLKRHLAQVHKVKMNTNEIHAHQNQLLGGSASTPTSHRIKSETKIEK